MRTRSTTWVSVAALIGLSVMASSCSMRMKAEKRLYRPGYHVEFSRSKKKPVPVLATASRATNQAIEKIVHDAPIEFNPIEEASVGNNSFAFAGYSEPDKPRILYSTHNLNPEKPGATALVKDYLSKRVQPQKATRMIKKMERKEYHSIANDDINGGKFAFRIIGICLSLIGFLVFLFVSWLIGLIVLLLGVGLLIAGINRNSRIANNSSKNSGEEWQDVVYLKNGSIIRGMIIEQIPNRSLKIMTADGSVFVYEIDQVEKITKEQR